MRPCLRIVKIIPGHDREQGHLNNLKIFIIMSGWLKVVSIVGLMPVTSSSHGTFVHFFWQLRICLVLMGVYSAKKSLFCLGPWEANPYPA